jgi:two-component system, NarL family, invasion response regulator UvrY
MTKIILADDHAYVRRGLKDILTETGTMEVIGEAGTIDELGDLVRRITADIVILDLTMAGRNAIDTIEVLKRQFPQLKIVVLTMHAEEDYALRAFRAGADGYLTKETAPEQLVQAVNKAMSGGKYVSPSFAEKLVAGLQSEPASSPHELLTERERTVMLMLARGARIKEIAQEMGLSAKTVTTYRTRILGKMNFRTNADLTTYAHKHGLI